MIQDLSKTMNRVRIASIQSEAMAKTKPTHRRRSSSRVSAQFNASGSPVFAKQKVVRVVS